jgi:hypothetical protein
VQEAQANLEDLQQKLVMIQILVSVRHVEDGNVKCKI